MIKGLQYPSYEERLRELGLVSLEKGRICGHTVVAFLYLEGPTRETETVLLAGPVGTGQEVKVLNQKRGDSN